MSQQMLERAREKFSGDPHIQFLQGDIHHFEALGAFDIILCTWILEHIEDRVGFINDILLHMKKRSKLFLLFYSRPKWYLNYTVFPFIRFLFKGSARDVSPEEIKKFKQVRSVQSFSGGMVTAVEIEA